MLLIVEDGTLLTDDVTQTNNTDSTYSQSQSLSATDFSSTTTASGGNRADNTITRDLTAETLEGSTLDWSSYSSSTTTPAGTTTTSGSSSDDTLYKFVRALVPPGDQDGWQPQVYEHHTVYSEQTTYPDGTTDDYGWDETDNDAGGADPFALMHPPVLFGGPSPYPSGGQFAAATAADQPTAGTPYTSEGDTPDGGHWERTDDGYSWSFQQWDAQGNLITDESGIYQLSGPAGFDMARDAILGGQMTMAPLNTLGGVIASTLAATGDLDGDGTPDNLDADTDGDGIPNEQDPDDDGNGVRDWEEEQESQRRRDKVTELTDRYYTIYNLASRVRQNREAGDNSTADAFQTVLESNLNVIRDLEEELGRLPGAGDSIAYRTINGLGDEALDWSLVEKLIHAIEYAYDNGMFEDEVEERVENLLEIAQDPAALAQFAATFLTMHFLMQAVKKAGMCGPAGAALGAGQAAAHGIRISALIQEIDACTFSSEVETFSDEVVDLTADLLRDVGVIRWIRSKICFAAGTLVLSVDDGGKTALRPIETLVEGDVVLAREEYGEKLTPRTIVATSRRLAPGLLHVTYADAEGREHTLDCTDEHPFWVANRNADAPIAEERLEAATHGPSSATTTAIETTGSWIPAKHLQPGDQLTSPDGESLVITAVTDETLPAWQPVYNLTVAQDPTYFVTPPGDTAGTVLVHNACTPNRWSYRKKWHDDRADAIFGGGKGRSIGSQRHYDKHYSGRDIEFKSNNFKRELSNDELDRMREQIGKDIGFFRDGIANPHWHFDHDPSQSPAMLPLLKMLEDAGIGWTWGSDAPF